MPDKSNFTPDEWKLLLESVTMAGIAVSAAEPSGLWGLLKESFAEGSALMMAKMDPKADALIKAVVADFETAEGRSTARDGLKEKLASQVHRDAAAGWRRGGCQGARRCSGLQRRAAPDQPTPCRGLQGGRISWHRRLARKRSGEGNAQRDLECAQTGGMIRCVHAANQLSPASLSASGQCHG